jgi:protein SCO1
MTRGFAPLLGIVVLGGIGTLAWCTEGFQVITSDGARRLAIQEAPRPVPRVLLTDQDGVRFTLDAYRGKVLLIDFIYTSCPTLCTARGGDFARMQSLVRRGIGGRDVALLSISFDLAHDRRAELAAYGERFGAVAPRWRIAIPADEAGLRALLGAFGVVVIPDGDGGFTHDGAIYVVDGRGRIVRALDPDSPAALVEEALRSAVS